MPLDQSIPGARSTKVVLDQLDGDKLYFQNSKKYQIHYEFASAHLSGNGLPFVDTLPVFNDTQYSHPERRFVLGAVTYYEGPGAWALEMSPYDTASAAMVSRLYDAVKKNAYFGPGLKFHPTSEPIAAEVAKAPSPIAQITTDDDLRRHRLPAAQSRNGRWGGSSSSRRSRCRPNTWTSRTSSCSTRSRTTSPWSAA